MAEGRSSVAQWVVPKRNLSSASRSSSRNKGNKKRNSSNRQDQTGPAASRQTGFGESDHDSNSNPILHNNPAYDEDRSSITDQDESTVVDLEKEAEINQEAAKVEDSICRTICVIVEEYLKELREHQKQINQARTRLLTDIPQAISDANFIASNDLLRLRVRDEQTKAIETIKHLTNYLKQLSIITRQETTVIDPVSEDIYNKLADLRNNIIHTLNDFVIANSDIDVPIVDSDDPASGIDYDLCIDAQRSPVDLREIEFSESNDSGTSLGTGTTKQQHGAHQQLRKRPLANRNNIGVLDDPERTKGESVDCGDRYKLMSVHDDFQLVEVEKRKREISKLEKDTVELRSLFADFYNLVKMQGEQVDTIENNLELAAQHIAEARNNLNHQALSTKNLRVLVTMTGCLTGALIGGPIGLLVGGKVGGLTIVCATSLLGLLTSLGAQSCIETGKTKRITG